MDGHRPNLPKPDSYVEGAVLLAMQTPETFTGQVYNDAQLIEILVALLILGIMTALGYETCSRVAKQALAQKRRVADIVLEEKLLTPEQIERLFRPEAMTAPVRSSKSF